MNFELEKGRGKKNIKNRAHYDYWKFREPDLHVDARNQGVVGKAFVCHFVRLSFSSVLICGCWGHEENMMQVKLESDVLGGCNCLF